MWSGTAAALEMTQGDYGVVLPIHITGVTLTSNDRFRIVINDPATCATVLEKDYTSVSDNTIALELSEEESALLYPKKYTYSLDWYQSGSFLCNLVPRGTLKVGAKG